MSIGVSNFDIRHLEELRKISGIIPAVNQIECHPLCYPSELIEYCKAFGIQVQAYAPLARGAYFDNDVMCVLGTKYARTPAQIGLRWAVQKGISVIPKSSNPERIRSNGNILILISKMRTWQSLIRLMKICILLMFRKISVTFNFNQIK